MKVTVGVPPGSATGRYSRRSTPEPRIIAAFAVGTAARRVSASRSEAFWNITVSLSRCSAMRYATVTRRRTARVRRLSATNTCPRPEIAATTAGTSVSRAAMPP